MTDDQIHHIALQTLQNYLSEAGAKFDVQDGDIVLNQHRLGLSIAFDGFQQQNVHRIAPVEFQVYLDGDNGDRFRVGVIGVGDTEDLAVRAAVEEWHVLMAVPLLTSLGAAAGQRRREPTTMQISGWDVIPGRACFRGVIPEGLQGGGTFFQSVVRAIRDTVVDWQQPDGFTLRSILLMASAEAGQHEAQAAVDGLVDEQLTLRMNELPWPAAEGAYFYKQVFVLSSQP